MDQQQQAKRSTDQAEQAAYDKAKAANTRAEWDAFIAKYPQGQLINDARTARGNAQA